MTLKARSSKGYNFYPDLSLSPDTPTEASHHIVRKPNLSHTDMGMAHVVGPEVAQRTPSTNNGEGNEHVCPRMTPAPGF